MTGTSEEGKGYNRPQAEKKLNACIKREGKKKKKRNIKQEHTLCNTESIPVLLLSNGKEYRNKFLAQYLLKKKYM